jgi:hypothetical protein
MSNSEWDGVTQPDTLNDQANTLRQQLADAAKGYDWKAALSILASHPSLINITRPGGQSRYTVLHQAAHGGAPADVVTQLLALGAWRTLRTAQGERAVDIAQRQGHAQLMPLLTPALKRSIAPELLQSIQGHFHEVIRGRMAEGNLTVALRLPELEPLLELERPAMWFPVPGMYGGFSYELNTVSGGPVLISESWCRVVGGSGQRHLVSPHGSLLLEEGFV